MPTRVISFRRPLGLLLRFLVLLPATLLWPGALAADSATASKDCSLGPPCMRTEAQFTLLIAQTIQWQATFTGTSNQGGDEFWLSTVSSNNADIPLTTTGQTSGSKALAPGTYFISIRLFAMGPGTYTVNYNPSSTGEPHITTIDGTRYDFQGVGEFVLLRNEAGVEIQTRQGPIATTYNPGPDPHDELALCVSINTAVAARAGKRRISYEPNLSGVPNPTGLQLRVDGVLTTVGSGGLDLGNGARVSSTAAPGGLELDFPDRSILFVTPGWWADQGKWYLNLNIVPARAAAGLAGVIAPRSWLPALPSGASMGSLPGSLHDRYVDLYQKFADAWRVTSATSLFDYAAGTSTDTFTMRNWPPEHPPCTLPGTIPAEPVGEHVAKLACQAVIGENARCVFDVMVTGNPGFATTYALSQNLQATHVPTPCNMTLLGILGGLLLIAVVLLLICMLRR